MYGLTYIDRNNVSTAAFVFKRDLNLTNTQVGLVFSAFAYPYLLFQIFGGWVSDRFGARISLTASALVWGTATLLTGMASGLAGILCARVLLGFGEGATFPTATRAMSDWLPEGKRAIAQGITHSSSRLGNALTPPLVAWLITVVTWRGSFIILGIISLVWAVMWGLYFRNNPAEHPAITAQELEALPKYATRQQKKNESIPWIRLTVRMLPVTAVYFCYAWTLWLYLAWIPSFFLHSYGLKLQGSALFSAGVFFAGVLGNTVGGYVSDWIFGKTRNRDKARRNPIVVGFLCSAGAMVALLFTHNLTSAAIFLSLAFFFSECTTASFWAVPMDIAPRFCGSASGLMNSGSALAAIISPLVFGYVIDKTGNWKLPFWGSIALLFFGAILAFSMKPNEGLAGAQLSDVTPSAVKQVTA
jgi:MFS family permease